jgi:hypothetical protein
VAGRLKADLLVILWTLYHVKNQVAAVCCHEAKVLHFGFLYDRPAAHGDLLACRNISSENDSMLSLTLIFRNFHLATRVRIGGGRFLNQLRSPQSSSDAGFRTLSEKATSRLRDLRWKASLSLALTPSARI